MADNLTTQSATLATVPASSVIATDDAGAGGHVQIVKLAIGTDGSATVIPADATNGLDVDVTRIAAGDNLVGRVKVSDGTDVMLVNTDGSISTRPVLSTQVQTSTGLTTASTSYAANDVLGDGWSFTSMGTTGYIVAARLLDKADLIFGVDLILHSASVTFGTDNSAPSRSDTDAEKECGQLSVVALDEGAQRVAISGPTMTPYHTDAGTLYVAGVTRAAHSFFGAVGDLMLRLYYIVST